MKIVIIGDGKVGHKLAVQLSEEDYDIVLIDQNEGKLKAALNQLDIFCITGNGADAEVQKQADVPHADLVIACSINGRDEYAELSSGKKAGSKTYDSQSAQPNLLQTDGSSEGRPASEYGG